MGASQSLDSRFGMASPWRRRRMCLLVGDRPAPAALREVSAAGAFLETHADLKLGTQVELRHPEAGVIHAQVRSVTAEGVGISFDFGEASVAFALAAIAADMSRPEV
jgi:hypothetical protein